MTSSQFTKTVRSSWRHIVHGEPNPPAWLMFLFRPALWAGVAVLIFAVVTFLHGNTFAALNALSLAYGCARWAWAETRDATNSY
jgi:hypothetical protein